MTKEKKMLPAAVIGIENKAFYSIKEAAEAIGVHFQTLRNWLKAGTVYSARLGGPKSKPVIPRSEVLRVLAKLDAKRAVDEPSFEDSSLLMRVEDILGAENVYPLVKRLLAGWLVEHQARLDGELRPASPQQPGPPSGGDTATGKATHEGDAPVRPSPSDAEPSKRQPTPHAQAKPESPGPAKLDQTSPANAPSALDQLPLAEIERLKALCEQAIAAFKAAGGKGSASDE